MKEIKFAARQSFPVFCGYTFLGIAFGLVLNQAGYGWPWALAISVFVFAGSLQFVLAGMLGTAGLLSIALTTLSVNSRHLFYGLSFLEKFKEMGKARPYMIFSLTDETYSLLCSVKTPEGMDENKVFFWISLLDHSYWVMGSLIGGVLGDILPFDMTGIDFAMTALFVVIFVEQWLGAKTHLPALVGVGFGVLSLLVFGPANFLLPALICTVLALTFCRPVIEAKTAAKEEQA